MITPSFSLTATERVLPKLALDFTTASLDPRVTFTRTTGASNPATYVASTGYVTAATNNQPRFDFDPVALTCKGLLIEESRSNLTSYSQQFDDASWGRSNIQAFGSGSIVDAAVSPDGTQNADMIAETTASATHNMFKGYGGTTNTNPYSISLFIKANTRPALELQFFEGSTFARYAGCVFNAQGGTMGAPYVGGGAASVSATMTNFGNGWYRCTVTATLGGADTTIQSRFLINNGTTSNYTGDGTSGIYIWGAQLEAGAFATSYIPTTTTALTRNADVATMTGTNFSSWFNATEGTYVVWGALPSNYSTGFQTFFQSSDGTAANRLNAVSNSGADVINMEMTTSSSVVAGFYPSYTSGNTKLAFSYKLNNTNYGKDGTSGTTDTSCTIPTMSQLNIGANHSPGNYLNGYVQKIFYYPQRLINAELAATSK